MGFEKILEEIEKEFDRRIDTQLKIMAGLSDDVYRYGYGKSLEAYQQGKILVEDIIRKHMNDGWIPVEERLPGTQKEAIENIKEYIRKCNYTWSVKSIFNEYIKHLNGAYVSYTARDVIENCHRSLEKLSAKALEEIQQYREAGTIEKFRKAKDYKCQHDSMFMIDIDFAKYLFCKNILVFKLFDNGDERIVADLDDMIEHSARGGLFGVGKDDLDDII